MCYIDIPTSEVDFVDINTRWREKFSSPRLCLEIPMNIIKMLENRYISLEPKQKLEQVPLKKQIFNMNKIELQVEDFREQHMHNLLHGLKVYNSYLLGLLYIKHLAMDYAMPIPTAMVYRKLNKKLVSSIISIFWNK